MNARSWYEILPVGAQAPRRGRATGGLRLIPNVRRCRPRANGREVPVQVGKWYQDPRLVRRRRAVASGTELVADDKQRQLDAVGDAHFVVNVRDVVLDRLLRQSELQGDVPI